MVKADAVIQELEENGEIGRVRAEEGRKLFLVCTGLGETFLHVAKDRSRDCVHEWREGGEETSVEEGANTDMPRSPE